MCCRICFSFHSFFFWGERGEESSICLLFLPFFKPTSVSSLPARDKRPTSLPSWTHISPCCAGFVCLDVVSERNPTLVQVSRGWNNLCGSWRSPSLQELATRSSYEAWFPGCGRCHNISGACLFPSILYPTIRSVVSSPQGLAFFSLKLKSVLLNLIMFDFLLLFLLFCIIFGLNVICIALVLTRKHPGLKFGSKFLFFRPFLS